MLHGIPQLDLHSGVEPIFERKVSVYADMLKPTPLPEEILHFILPYVYGEELNDGMLGKIVASAKKLSKKEKEKAKDTAKDTSKEGAADKKSVKGSGSTAKKDDSESAAKKAGSESTKTKKGSRNIELPLRVAKYFDGDPNLYRGMAKTFEMVVDESEGGKEKPFYFVEYDDGDSEHMPEGELLACAALEREHAAQIPVGKKRRKGNIGGSSNLEGSAKGEKSSAKKKKKKKAS